MNTKLTLLSLMVAASALVVSQSFAATKQESQNKEKERPYAAKVTNNLPFPIKAKIECMGVAKDKGYEDIAPGKSNTLRCLRGTLTKGVKVKYTVPGSKTERTLDLDWRGKRDEVAVNATCLPTWDIKQQGTVWDGRVTYTLTGFKVAVGFDMDEGPDVLNYQPPTGSKYSGYATK